MTDIYDNKENKMTKLLEFELQNAADRLIREMLKVKNGETVVITADTCSNEAVVNATAASVYAAGGKPMVITTATPSGVGKAADKDLPVEALGAALSFTDVWIEYNKQWLLYSTPFESAFNNNKKIRYINLVEMNPDLMIRNIGNIDIGQLAEFMCKFEIMNKAAKTYRVTTTAGTNLTFETNPLHLVCNDCGDASKPGMNMMPGQLNIVPEFDTVQGTIVFDGSLVPPFRLLDAPVKLTIENSKIVKVEGGIQAEQFSDWLNSFGDPNMFKLAHMAYGLNPGAKLTGDIVEDERVWGCVEWGIGYVSPIDAPPAGQDAKSHCDGICLNASVWLDDVQVLDRGKFVHPELKAYEDKIFKRQA